jgi:acetate---CoA ligase (ADP-forming)
VADLTRLLDPASVAFIGGERAAFAIEQSRLLGYEGAVFAVNPSRPDLAGVATVPVVTDLPAIPDAAFVAVDRVRSIEVVAALRELGCGGVVCYASGYAESGAEGAELQARLVAAAGDMPMIGPNCHGYVNALSGAVLWPDVQGCRRIERGVAIVTQSGNLAINITMQQRGLPLAQVITLGNQAGVGIEDCVEALVSDDRITAVGLHLEALSDPARFAASAVQAHRMGKPIVALKTGLTDAGAAIARTHTASLAGSAAAYQALFDRVGVVQVESLPVMLGALAVLGIHGRLAGNRLTSLSCSGGEAGLIADRAAGLDVDFPAFDAVASSRIADTLENRVPITNPLDYHTFIWGDRAAMTACFSETLRGGVDAGILVIDFPVPEADDSWWWPTLESFVEAHRITGVPGVVTSTLPENLPVRVARWLAERGVPALPGIDDALAALAAASRPAPTDPSLPLAVAVGNGSTGTLGEHQVKVRLSEAGVPVPRGLVAPRTGLAAAAAAIGYPVVLKAIGLDHKTDAGGVVVDLGSAEELERAVTSMSALGSSFLVERFESGAVAELVVGVRREPPLGWAVTIGSGGVLVELMADTVTLLAPVTAGEVEAALRSLRVWPMLAGHRGRPGGDVTAAVEAISRIVEMVVSDGTFVELEVNPLLVLPEYAVAVDALAVVQL